MTEKEVTETATQAPKLKHRN